MLCLQGNIFNTLTARKYLYGLILSLSLVDYTLLIRILFFNYTSVQQKTKTKTYTILISLN